MSIDYYLLKNPCPHCDTPEKKIKIGTSSSGWCFGLHVMPHLGIKSLVDWVALFNDPNNVIKNNYGDTVSPDEMIGFITKRSWRMPDNPAYIKDDHWYERNHALPGPNGLSRHKIDGSYIIGHGEGTWDYILDQESKKYEEW
jgi:hypothetical protein